MAQVYTQQKLDRIHSTRTAVEGRIYESNTGILFIGNAEGFLERSKDLKGTIDAKTLKNDVPDSSYIHTQGSAATVWYIKHNLNKRPSITIVDTGDNVVEGQEIYKDNNNVELHFEAAFTGKAYLN